MENKYYLYRHIRLDKNEVFYVGIGSKQHENTTYYRIYGRAFAKGKDARTNWWMNIFLKTEIRVEILMESDDVEFIKQKEIEFIKLYGRKDLGLGTLVNLTDGGEGIHNYKMSESRRLSQLGANNKFSKELFVYSSNGNFYQHVKGINQFSKAHNIHLQAIPPHMRGIKRHVGGLRFFTTYQGETICPLLNYKPGEDKFKKVAQMNDEYEVITIFKSAKEAAKILGRSPSNIHFSIKHKTKRLGYYWKHI